MKRDNRTYPHYLADGRAFPSFTAATDHGDRVAARDGRTVPIFYREESYTSYLQITYCRPDPKGERTSWPDGNQQPPAYTTRS